MELPTKHRSGAKPCALGSPEFRYSLNQMPPAAFNDLSEFEPVGGGN